MSRFENKLIMITASGNGVGAACADHFAEEGALLAAIDREAEELKRSLTGLPSGRVYSRAGDCTDAEALNGFFEGAAQTFGQVDVLFNRAGQSSRERASAFHLSHEEGWRFVLEVSLLTTMRLSLLVAPGMREHGGRIIKHVERRRLCW